MDSACLLSMVPADVFGGVIMEQGIFSQHTLRPLVPIKYLSNAAVYLSIVPQFMTTMHPSYGGHFQQDNASGQIRNSVRLSPGTRECVPHLKMTPTANLTILLYDKKMLFSKLTINIFLFRMHTIRSERLALINIENLRK